MVLLVVHLLVLRVMLLVLHPVVHLVLHLVGHLLVHLLVLLIAQALPQMPFIQSSQLPFHTSSCVFGVVQIETVSFGVVR